MCIDNVTISVENLLRGRRMKRMVEALSNDIREKYHLKQVELEILYYIVKIERPISASEITNNMCLNKGQVSRALTQIVEDGYITAIPDEKDHRVVWYQGKDIAGTIIQEFDEEQKKMGSLIYQGITEEELNCFRKVCCKVLRNMDQIDLK